MEAIAEVYGRSLFEVAHEQGKVDVVREQLGAFADALEGRRELAVFFFSPYFSTKEKEDALGRAVQGADEVVLNFLRVLIENHRMPAIFRIRRELDDLWAAEQHVLPVQITSATELDEATVRSLGERIGEQTGQRVQLTTQVEPDILGGIVLRVGNQILDASVRNRLERLRHQVARGSVSA
jgi:F-type H+-transporting ATPase subunit delta